MIQKENRHLRNLKPGSRERDGCFMVSIAGIAGDIVFNELKGREIRTVVLVSTFDGDGKSEIADHLACEFAFSGTHTLLLNMDRPNPGGYVLRMRSFKEEGQMPEITGTNVSNLDYSTLYSRLESRIPDYDRESLKELFDLYSEKYRRIIVDTSSLSADVSGFIAAGLADAVYFICSRKNMRAWEITDCYNRLRDIGANMPGIIYNRCSRRTVRKIYKQDGREKW